MIVKVAPMGEQVVEVNVNSGQTVRECLEIADVECDGRAITVNNVSATEDTPVTADGAVISLANKMKGGRS